MRVETRLDDGSISPVALSGGFRPTERAYAHVALRGQTALEFAGRCEYDERSRDDVHGRGRVLMLSYRDAARGAVLRREVVLHESHPYALLRTSVTNTGDAPMSIEALVPFSLPASGRGRLKLASWPDVRIYRHGWQSWSPTMSLGGAQRDLRSAPPVLSSGAPIDRTGAFNSEDVAVLYDPVSRRSMLAGAVSARDFVTCVFIDVPARRLEARCEADGLLVAPGETLWSESVAIDVCGDPSEQLERYGEALGREMGARVPAAPPSGWCSWYYYYTTVTEEDVIANLRFLEQHRRELPIDTVQIDDGYQSDIGDWLTPNEKFPHGMGWLASQIKAAGYTPGIWLAPFLLAETSKTYAGHPQWVVRDDSGEPVIATQNWQRANFGLDGSHPAALEWLRSVFREVCDGWGYDYVKIDFLFAAAIAGRRIDPSATRIRAYRQALSAVRDAVGDRRFVLGCGALMAASVGKFDGNRIGPDVAPFWRFLTKEERASPRPRPRRPDDDLSAETAIRNTLTRSWMHGRLWANDPDCLLVRGDRTKLMLDEVRTLATAIALSGGMLLSSDDLTRLTPDRLDIISALIPPLPQAAVPVDLMLRDIPEIFELSITREFAPVRLAGVFNFDDDAKDIQYALPAGRYHVFEFWSERYLGVLEGAVTMTLVEPHGCRLLAIRPAADLPALVGTNAHIGCGALDVDAVGVDRSAIRVGLTPSGRRRRRLFFATMGRVPQGGMIDGRPVALEVNRDVCVVSVDVNEPVELLVPLAS
jgi:alpha-galactosidase